MARGLLAGAAVLISATAALADAATETVVVTGTRIPRPEYDLPNPTVTIGADQIQHSGTTDLGDYLKQVPALVGSLGDFQTNGYGTPASADGSSLGGLSLLDLRNLGYVRTLVLLDGHRTVGQSPGSVAVDVKTIPITLIDRVEILTGGTSAVYGADSVSGVVNFVMKHDLDGVRARVQAGTSQDGGGSDYLVATSVGHNFDDDKGNLTLTYEGSWQDHLYFKQRDFTKTGGIAFFIANPANPDGSNPHLPQFVPNRDVQFTFSALTGAIDTDLDFFPDHLGTGGIYKPGIDIGNASAIGSSGTPYAEDLQGDFQPTTSRNIAQVDGSYEFSPMFQFTGEFKYAQVNTHSIATAPFDDFTILMPDNAFLPANVANLIRNNGAGFGVLSEDYQSIRNEETVNRSTYRLMLDMKGELPNPSFLDNFKYDATYVYGQTDVDDVAVHNRLTDRFFAALDSVIDPATGKPTCRSNLDPSAAPPDLSLVDQLFGQVIFGHIFSDTVKTGNGSGNGYPQSFKPGPNSGCVPFNPFGPNAASQAAINWATANTHTRGALMEHVLTGYVSGDFGVFKDWGFAGPLTLVIGGEYRKEASSANPDAIEQGDNAWNSGLSAVRGSFDVSEFFAEASLPVLADLPFAKELSLNGAVRQSNYSTAGDSTSWEMGAVWSPIETVKFRGTQAVAVRAPNVGELFAPNQNLFSNVADPCDATQINLGTQFRRANCIAALDAVLGPGVYVPGQTVLTTGATTPILIGGNPNLAPETARTYTAGIVVQPAGWNLSVALDWYDVKIVNAIQALSGQTISQECVDLSTIDNPFCAQVTRTPNGQFPGSISQIRAQQINVASYSTGGVDLTLDYVLDTQDVFDENDGIFTFHLIGNWLDHLTFQSLPTEAAEQEASYRYGGADGSPAPRWQTNLDVAWHMDQWTVDYDLDWYDHTLRATLQDVAAQPNIYAKQYLYIPDRFVHNVQIGYDFEEGWNAYFGVNNLFYQKPAIGESGYPVDPIGRFFYIGVKADLDREALNGLGLSL